MKKYTSILLVLLVVGFVSCKKEGCTDEGASNYNPDAKKDDGSCVFPEVEISFTSPEAHTTYGLNDTVHIHGSVSYVEEMHGYHLQLVNTSVNDTVVYEIHNHDHMSAYSIHGMWVNNVTTHSDMELRITVEKSHDGESVTHVVPFHCHPM